MAKKSIPDFRRISEAITTKLNYDYLCFKGPLFDEAYLSHSISDILVSLFDPKSTKIKKNYVHPALIHSEIKKGRKPAVDYAVTDRRQPAPNNVEVIIEAKWVSSTHCNIDNILWDLIRLKSIKNSNEEIKCGFIIAGPKTDFDNLFNKDLLREGGGQILHQTRTRTIEFNLQENQHWQEKINKIISKMNKEGAKPLAPKTIKTNLLDCTVSANDCFRFISRCWEIS